MIIETHMKNSNAYKKTRYKVRVDAFINITYSKLFGRMSPSHVNIDTKTVHIWMSGVTSYSEELPQQICFQTVSMVTTWR